MFQRRDKRSVTSDDSGVLLHMAKTDARSLASASWVTSSHLLRTPNSWTLRQDGVVARELTLTELREPSTLFTSRTPLPSVLRAASALQTEILSKPSSVTQPPDSLLSVADSLVADPFVVDPSVAKKLRLHCRYPLIPACDDLMTDIYVKQSAPVTKTYLNLYYTPRNPLKTY